MWEKSAVFLRIALFLWKNMKAGVFNPNFHQKRANFTKIEEKTDGFFILL